MLLCLGNCISFSSVFCTQTNAMYLIGLASLPGSFDSPSAQSVLAIPTFLNGILDFFNKQIPKLLQLTQNTHGILGPLHPAMSLPLVMSVIVIILVPPIFTHVPRPPGEMYVPACLHAHSMDDPSLPLTCSPCLQGLVPSVSLSNVTDLHLAASWCLIQGWMLSAKAWFSYDDLSRGSRHGCIYVM